MTPLFIASLGCMQVAIVALMRRLPAQNVAFIFVSLAAVELTLEYLFKSGNVLGCAMFWPGFIILSRIAAQVLLKPWRQAANYGLCLLCLTSSEAPLAQAFFTPARPAIIAGRFFVTAVCLLFLTPWFLQKRIVISGEAK